MQYIDAHCHTLTNSDIRAARAVGAVGFVCNATLPDNWGRTLDLARAHNDVRAAIGVHPWYIQGLANDWDMGLSDVLAAYPECEVGEIGLDRSRPNMSAQIQIFRRQLEIAHRFNRTAHIHCVGAWGAMMDVLRSGSRPGRVVMHAYAGAVDLIPELARMGAYFSFGGAVLDGRHVRMRRAVMCAPIDHILVESDAPDSGIAPADVRKIIFEIAKIRGTSNTHMADILYANAQRMLNNG